MVGDLLYLVSGGVATWLLQFLKAALRLQGRGMMWAAVIVSLALGVVTTGLTSGWAILLNTPWVIFTSGSAVFATATVIYKGLAAKFDLSLEGMLEANGETVTAKAVTTPKARTAAPVALKIGTKLKEG